MNSEAVGMCMYVGIIMNAETSDFLFNRRDLKNPSSQKHIYIHITYIYWVSQEECVRLREGVPYGKVYRYNPRHLRPKLNGYGDNGQRSLKL
jgi:hypothetical protein